MPKRFTDTEKWSRPWFRQLPYEYKLLWLYICDNCDSIGIWYVDMQLATFQIGIKVDEANGEHFLSKQIEILEKGTKWRIKDFVFFQHGELSSNNNFHRSLISKIQRLKTSGAEKPLSSPLSGVKEKDKDKVMIKEQVILKNNNSNEPQKETEIQKIVKGWKILTNIPIEGDESKAWDKAHFARNAKSAKFLLDLFGYKDALSCMEFVFDYMKDKKLDCTLETIVKRSDLFREQLAGGNR